ncbi:MAG: bidirectional hydrogenase complex protein HoxE [Nodosilinea sp. LVE1205-7]
MATTIASTPSPSPASHPDLRFKRLDIAMKRHQYRPDALIEVLHVAQEIFGFLEAGVLAYVAHGLRLPLSKVYGVATFYHLFSLKPLGVHSCVVCMGTACYVKGSSQILEGLQAELAIQVGETTADGQVSLTAARCLGACGIAPAVVLDGEVLGKLDPAAAIARVQALQQPAQA